MQQVVVEVRGGLVVEIYCDTPGVRAVVVDWDKYEDGLAEDPPAFEWTPPLPLAMLPEDTRREFAVYMEAVPVAGS